MDKRRILLVIPPPEHRVISGSRSTPPVSLGSLASVLLADRHKVKVFDGSVEPRERLARLLVDFKPDICGISAVTMHIRAAERVAAMARTLRPGIRTLVGGPHVSAAPRETMREFRHFDIGVVGEGERPLHALANSNFSPPELSRIKGLIYRDGDHLIETGPGPFIKDLDSLPFPAWHLFDLDRYASRTHSLRRSERQLIICVGRGCVYNCAFCDVPARPLAMRSEKTILEEIQQAIQRYMTDRFWFLLETFTLRKDRVLDICSGIIDRRLRIRWGCHTRVDRIDEELCRTMAIAGCHQIYFGIDAGNKEMDLRMNKGTRIEWGEIIKAIRIVRKYGIEVNGNIMLGFPGETVESARRAVSRAMHLGLDVLNFPIFTPYPGTQARSDIESSSNYRIKSNDWEDYNQLRNVYLVESNEISEKELISIRRKGLFRFYLRPSKILRLAKHVRPSTLLFFLKTSLGGPGRRKALGCNSGTVKSAG